MFTENLPDDSAIHKMDEEATAEFEKDNIYWNQNRSDSLSHHGKDM